MNTFDSQKVIAHIEDAQNWLDEAKTEYQHSNQVRGELNLNLAQAEVKYAWELSRNQNVKQSKQSGFHKQPKYHIPAVAASIVVFVGLGAGLYLGMANHQPKPVALTVKNNTVKDHAQPETNPPVIGNTDKLPEKVVNTAKPMIAGDSSTAEVKVKPQVTKRNEPAAQQPTEIVKTEVIKPGKQIVAVRTPAGEVAVARKNVKTTVVPVSVTTPVIQETSEPTVAFGKTSAQQERDSMEHPAKPVAIPLLIDEEALAKEASYSLRNGK